MKLTLPYEGKQGGFSLIELVTVVAIAMIIAAFAVPRIVTMMHIFRLRGTATDFAGIVQTTRWRSIQDDRFYSARFLTAGGTLEAYVDIYPQAINGSSGHGAGGPIDPQDPQMPINSEVAPQPESSAPGTTNLKAQILPSGSTVVPNDGTSLTTPITFGPHGLPCVPTATNGGSVCNSAGGTQAYWVFFQDTATGAWSAVTVTPAGRIQTWYYSESGWVNSQT